MKRIWLLAFLMALAACGTESTPLTSADQPAIALEDLIGTWVLEDGSIGGAEFVPVGTHPVTLVISPGELGGLGGCNGYGGRLLLTPEGGIVLLDVAMTAMACEPAGVMAVEQRYMEALASVDRAQRTGDKLLLSGPEVDVRFSLAPALDTASVVDVEWILVGIGSGDAMTAPAGERATLLMSANGGVTAATGCRTLQGTWTESGDTILFPNLAASGECSADLAAQDSLVISVLGDGFRIAVADAQLVLTSQGGDSLTYRSDA